MELRTNYFEQRRDWLSLAWKSCRDNINTCFGFGKIRRDFKSRDEGKVQLGRGARTCTIRENCQRCCCYTGETPMFATWWEARE